MRSAVLLCLALVISLGPGGLCRADEGANAAPELKHDITGCCGLILGSEGAEVSHASLVPFAEHPDVIVEYEDPALSNGATYYSKLITLRHEDTKYLGILKVATTRYEGLEVIEEISLDFGKSFFNTVFKNAKEAKSYYHPSSATVAYSFFKTNLIHRYAAELFQECELKVWKNRPERFEGIYPDIYESINYEEYSRLSLLEVFNRVGFVTDYSSRVDLRASFLDADNDSLKLHYYLRSSDYYFTLTYRAFLPRDSFNPTPESL